MAKVSPWFSIKTMDVHHNSTQCNTGNNIEKENRREGTGGLPRCQECAPKSNRAGTAYWAAMDDVQRHGSLPVPKPLRSGTWRERRDFGHGAGYLYPARSTR